MPEIQITFDNDKNEECFIEFPLDDYKFVSLQEQDLKIQELQDKIINGQYDEFYLIKNNMVMDSMQGSSHTDWWMLYYILDTINLVIKDTREFMQQSSICITRRV